MAKSAADRDREFVTQARTMRILHYMKQFRLEDGGVVRAVIDLCQALAERGHDVQVLTRDASDVPQGWLTGQAATPRVELLSRAPILPRLTRDSARQARRCMQSVDVVHLHVPWDPICPCLAQFTREQGIPYVVSLHGMLDEWCMARHHLKKRAHLALMGRRLLEQAAAVHCTAEAERAQAAKWYPRGKSVVVPLIFDLDEYEALPGPGLARKKFASAFPDDSTAVLLFLSRLHYKKGLEVLIDAGALLRDAGVRCKILIAGRGEPAYEQRLRRLIQDRDLGERISFLGFVSGREKISLYEAADLFVLPTSQENWGFVLLESLACATPVITTKGVDIWPELESSGGALIAELTPQAMADAVANLLRDPERLGSMRTKGRDWVLENLSLEQVLGRYEQLYRDISAGHS